MLKILKKKKKKPAKACSLFSKTPPTNGMADKKTQMEVKK